MSKPLYIDWYPQAALDGMNQLSALEELAYRRILDMIFVTDDNLIDDDKVLSWSTKTGKAWKKVKAKLIALGKIEVKEGKIRNRKAGLSLSQSRHRIEQKSVAGKASATARHGGDKPRKNKDTGSTAVNTDVGSPVTMDVQTPDTTAAPTAEPTNYQLSNNTLLHHQHTNAPREPDAPPKIDDDVDEVIRIFEEEREKVLGTKRDKPRRDDVDAAKAILATGADPDTVRDAFRKGFQTCRDTNRDAPGGLRYFESEIKTRMTAKTEKPAPAKPQAQPLDVGDIVNPEWRKIIENLRKHLTDPVIRSWILPLRYIETKDGELHIEAKSRFVHDEIAAKFASYLKAAANAQKLHLYIGAGQ